MITAVNRRQFIRLAGSGVALVLSAGCDAGTDYDTTALARTGLVAALGPDVVRGIGSQYRAMTPDERSAGSLRVAILASRPWAARVPGSRQPPVAELVQSDFEHGRIVVVQGWVLSETEARQCALYSLMPA